jgi:hypothetical protein
MVRTLLVFSMLTFIHTMAVAVKQVAMGGLSGTGCHQCKAKCQLKSHEVPNQCECKSIANLLQKTGGDKKSLKTLYLVGHERFVLLVYELNKQQGNGQEIWYNFFHLIAGIRGCPQLGVSSGLV